MLLSKGWPFCTWTHSYLCWISSSTGFTFPYLNTFVLLLNIMLYWIYLSILEHIRTSTGYHVLLDIPFHTWIHSYFYWILCSTGYTFPYLNTFVLLLNMLYVFNISRSTRKGASRNLGSKGVLHWFLRNIGRNARSLLSLSLEIINLHFKFGCTFIYCSQVLMRTSKVTYPIPCLPNNLI